MYIGTTLAILTKLLKKFKIELYEDGRRQVRNTWDELEEEILCYLIN